MSSNLGPNLRLGKFSKSCVFSYSLQILSSKFSAQISSFLGCCLTEAEDTLTEQDETADVTWDKLKTN